MRPVLAVVDGGKEGPTRDKREARREKRLKKRGTNSKSFLACGQSISGKGFVGIYQRDTEGKGP